MNVKKDGKGLRPREHEWLHKPKDCIREIKTHSVQIWINRCFKYIDEQEAIGKIPRLGGFFKEHKILHTWLTNGLREGNHKNDEELQEKYGIIKTLIAGEKKDVIIDKNIDKATFAVAMLQEEHNWDKKKDTSNNPIQLTIHTYSKLDGDVPIQLEEGKNENIIDVEGIGNDIEITDVGITDIDYDAIPYNQDLEQENE